MVRSFVFRQRIVKSRITPLQFHATQTGAWSPVRLISFERKGTCYPFGRRVGRWGRETSPAVIRTNRRHCVTCECSTH